MTWGGRRFLHGAREMVIRFGMLAEQVPRYAQERMRCRNIGVVPNTFGQGEPTLREVQRLTEIAAALMKQMERAEQMQLPDRLGMAACQSQRALERCFDIMRITGSEHQRLAEGCLQLHLCPGPDEIRRDDGKRLATDIDALGQHRTPQEHGHGGRRQLHTELRVARRTEAPREAGAKVGNACRVLLLDALPMSFTSGDAVKQRMPAPNGFNIVGCLEPGQEVGPHSVQQTVGDDIVAAMDCQKRLRDQLREDLGGRGCVDLIVRDDDGCLDLELAHEHAEPLQPESRAAVEQIVTPREGVAQRTVPGNRGTPAVPTDDLFLYPKNGQTSEQQSVDRYECHSWAKSQTGFDPTRAAGGVAPAEAAQKRIAYQRAMTACLEARGYSVK
jgi:hypothetical protein